MENKAERGIEFSPAVYEHFLREVYDGFDTSNDIEPQAWKEALRLMNEATVEGVSESKATTHDRRFLNNLRHSNEVFTAFKVHSMGVKMAERLYDSKGNLRSFAEFQKAVAPIASHQVGSWLRTEYNTAVRRAHLASDWQEFEANKDIFPNLRWMPTTSPNAEGSHRIYWERKLTLPINDPFWAKHHPGDRWNCKCSLEATDAPPTAPPSEREAPKPQRGLDRNPKDGQLFSDKHPYFPKDCASCFAYKQAKGARNLLRRLFENRQKDCYNCPYANGCVEKIQGISPPAVDTYVDLHKGKVLASPYHGDNEIDENKRLAIFLYNKLRRKVYLLPRLDPLNPIESKLRKSLLPKGVFEGKNPDFLINGELFDAKSMLDVGKDKGRHMTDEEQKKALETRFKKAKKQATNFMIEVPEYFSDEQIKNTTRNYLNRSKSNRTIMIKRGDSLHIYKKK